ncbi:MAG: ABC transporter ATP-binding protein [Spirochaetales bacterium]|nr:ABC transporter ATP-binding protein [Spirochaetales bacterium]
MNDPILELSGVVKTYSNGPERLPILKGLNFSSPAGVTSVILGESGSGKSTLLNLIGGLDKPDEGRVIVKGSDVTALSEDKLSVFRSRSVGFVFQFHYLISDFDAVENVMLPAYMTGTPRKLAERRAEELLRSVRMAERLRHYPHQLSGGERQRVAVARALINEPDILLADEPTGNLDEKNSDAVEELIFSLAETFGKTLVLVTHDANLAKRGNFRYLLHDGMLVER